MMIVGQLYKIFSVLAAQKWEARNAAIPRIPINCDVARRSAKISFTGCVFMNEQQIMKYSGSGMNSIWRNVWLCSPILQPTILSEITISITNIMPIGLVHRR